MIFGDETTIETIEDAVDAFRDHEGINFEGVRAWVDQFGKVHKNLAFKMLNSIIYYSGPKIRVMVEELVRLIFNQLQLNDLSDIIFVPIGNPSEGSYVITRAIRDIKGIRRNQIKSLSDLAVLPQEPSIDAIVFLEDFSGSGDRLLDWWKNIETLILPWAEKSVKILLGILVLNYKAEQVLNSLFTEMLKVDYLDEKYNILSNESEIFIKNEKVLIERFCKKTGSGSKFLKGYKNCGLLVAFKHGCPNNSLPLLWHQSDRWKKLFRRRAI